MLYTLQFVLSLLEPLRAIQSGECSANSDRAIASWSPSLARPFTVSRGFGGSRNVNHRLFIAGESNLLAGQSTPTQAHKVVGSNTSAVTSNRTAQINQWFARHPRDDNNNDECCEKMRNQARMARDSCCVMLVALVLGAGYWILVAGCWLLDASCSMLGARCWVLSAGCWGLCFKPGACAIARILVRGESRFGY